MNLKYSIILTIVAFYFSGTLQKNVNFTTVLQKLGWSNGHVVLMENSKTAMQLAWRTYRPEDPLFQKLEEDSSESESKLSPIFRICDFACRSINMEMVGMEFVTVWQNYFEFTWFMTKANVTDNGTVAIIPVVDITKACYLAQIHYDWQVKHSRDTQETIIQKCTTTAAQIIFTNASFLIACQSFPEEESEEDFLSPNVEKDSKPTNTAGMLIGLAMIAVVLVVIITCLLCVMRKHDRMEKAYMISAQKILPVTTISHQVSKSSTVGQCTPTRILFSKNSALQRRTPHSPKNCVRFQAPPERKPSNIGLDLQ